MDAIYPTNLTSIKVCTSWTHRNSLRRHYNDNVDDDGDGDDNDNTVHDAKFKVG